MKEALKEIINKLPYVSTLKKELDKFKTLYPPGHYYSPYPDLAEVKKNEEKLFTIKGKELPAIDLNEAEQLELLEKFKEIYPTLPFQETPVNYLRYGYENGMFNYSDAIFLACMLINFKPKRVIEVGSGYSSTVMLDCRDHFKMDTHFTFVEPDTSRLMGLLKKEDKNDESRVRIVNHIVQDVPLDEFRKLGRNDILFIDSSHIVKIGADVNYFLFEVLPALQSGVIIHVHDILYPFEITKKMIYRTRAYNETYALRAFLQYNNAFKIIAFNTFLEHFHKAWFEKNMPLCLKTDVTGHRGGSIWLQKV